MRLLAGGDADRCAAAATGGTHLLRQHKARASNSAAAAAATSVAAALMGQGQQTRVRVTRAPVSPRTPGAAAVSRRGGARTSIAHSSSK